MIDEGVGDPKLSIGTTLGRDRIYQVSHHWIAQAIAHKHNGKRAEEFEHKSGSIAVAQVGIAEIGTRKHQCSSIWISLVIFGFDPAMEVDNASRLLPPWPRQAGRRLDPAPLKAPQLEPVVEVGCDKPETTLPTKGIRPEPK